jgi:hypothetical protein
MNYVVMKSQQIAVEANDPEDAFRKVANGEGTVISGSMNASPRPERPQQPTIPNA